MNKILIAKAKEVFEKNRIAIGGVSFHQPALGEYESFFAWDSGWHIIALSLLDEELAYKELEAIFSFQNEDGSIPHEIRLEELGSSEHFSRLAYSKLIKNQFTDDGKSHMIDPPIYLLAAQILYNRTNDKRILDMLPKMKKCLDYYVYDRDLTGEGLVCIIHPWECGVDNAPYFDEPYGIKASNLLYKLKYEYKYIRDINYLNKLDWDTKKAFDEKTLIFQDVGINGIVATGAMALSKLFTHNNDKTNAALCKKQAEKIIAACEKYFWDKTKGFFYPRLINKDKQLHRTCINSLAPLMTGLVDKSKAKHMIENYLDSEKHFKTDWGIAFNSIEELGDAAWHNKDKMLWHGSCQWINMNWIAAKAAHIYGYKYLAKEIVELTVKLILKNDFREYYNPMTGEGQGAKNFTWPALVLDMIECYRID